MQWHPSRDSNWACCFGKSAFYPLSQTGRQLNDCKQTCIYRMRNRNFIVIGSIEENRYRYSFDALAKVSILRYPSENPHHELHIYKLVTYLGVFRLSDFEFFGFLRHLPHFCLFLVISILEIFFWGGGIFGHYFSDNTKYLLCIDTQ